jgi:hypothetical protein
MKNAEVGNGIASYGIGYSAVLRKFYGYIDVNPDSNLGYTQVLSAPVAPNAWHRVYLSFEENGSTDRLTLWVDNVIHDTVQGNYPVYYNPSQPNPFLIGAGNFDGDSGTYRRNFGGLIDEVMLVDQALPYFAIVPEPASVSLSAGPLALGLGGRASRRR